MKIQSEGIPLILRKIKFPLPRTKDKYWFNHDPVKSLYANAVCATIPYGERFIMMSVIEVLNTYPINAAQKARLQDFIQQEANHSREHYRFFRILTKPHYPTLAIKNQLFFKLAKILASLLGKKIRLAMAVAGEHLTTIISEYYLQHPAIFNVLDDNLSMLWQWHFIEEIEHKAVAFDLLISIKCNYITRLLGFFFATLILIGSFINPFLSMVKKDKLYKNKKFLQNAWQFFWRDPGIFRHLVIPYFRYLKPYFHPNDTDHSTLLNEWIPRLLAYQEM